MRDWGRGRRRTVAFLTGALIAILAVPAGAGAATVSIAGSTLTFSANSGETNDLIIETDGGVFRVIDNTAPVNAGAGCNQRSLHRVNCPTAGINLVQVLARDQDDDVLTLIGTTDASLNGGAGNDSLQSSDGDDVLTAGKGGGGFGGGESLTAGDGDDTLNGSTSSNSNTSMNGGPGDDDLLGGPASDFLFGDLGADLLQGGDGFDFVNWSGAAGVNVTLGSGANDGEPGEGDDVAGDVEFISGTSFADIIVGTGGDQQIFGGDGPDTLEGRGGNDFLDGGDGADTLRGDAGADTLQGGPRPDDFGGGAGTDLAQFGDHPAKVKVTIDNVANDGQSGGAEGDNVRTDVENLIGGPNDDLLIGSGQDNHIEGQGGNDDVRGEGGDDELFGDFQFNFGAQGNDQVGGGDGDDRLFGGNGADVFKGSPGFDFVDYSQHAGSMDLTVTIDNVANDGAAGEGDNVMDTVEGVVGGNGNDTITGSGAANTLFGGGGTDNLMGIGGKDLLDGETPGAFTAFSADVLNGGADVDTVSYRSHSFNGVTVTIDGAANDGTGGGSEGDNVMTNVENLIGSDGSDSLTGNNGVNTIAGRGGFDTLIGGASGDSLAGGGGSDTHEGQGGKDEINSRGDGFNDTDNCGTEADTAIVDAFDTVNPDCENVIP